MSGALSDVKTITGVDSMTISASNRTLFSQIVRAQITGKSALPFRLGLTEFEYKRLLKLLDNSDLERISSYWLHVDILPSLNPESLAALNAAKQKADLAEELRILRLTEWQELRSLIIQSKPEASFLDKVWASILATACLQPTHLWQSLGLENRAELSELLNHNFYSLASDNTKNMRWKRYFYLKLCATGGDYVCRAPSCNECSTFSECFGPE